MEFLKRTKRFGSDVEFLGARLALVILAIYNVSLHNLWNRIMTEKRVSGYYNRKFRARLYLVVAGYLDSGLSDVEAIKALEAQNWTDASFQEFRAAFFGDECDQTLDTGRKLLSIFKKLDAEEAALLVCVGVKNQASPRILRDLSRMIGGPQ